MKLELTSGALRLARGLAALSRRGRHLVPRFSFGRAQWLERLG